MNLAEISRSAEHTSNEESHPEYDVRLQSGRDPQHRNEEREEQQSEADVVLRAENRHGESPREENRQQYLWRDDLVSTDSLRRCRQQFAIGGEVRGEEEDQQDLGDLDGLKRNRPDNDPESGSIDVLTDVWNEWHQ